MTSRLELPRTESLALVVLGGRRGCAKIIEVRGQNDQTLAVHRYAEGVRQDEAEVIDLIKLPLGTRPTPICGVEFDEVPELRQMDCDFYQRCLGFAAQVRWRSFHCRQCPRHPDRVARNPDAARAEPRPMPDNVIPLRPE